MKINRQKLVRFLELSILTSDVQERGSLWLYDGKTLKTLLKSEDKIMYIKGIAKQKDGKMPKIIGINDLVLLKSIAESLREEEIDISVKDNKMTLKTKDTSFNTILRNPEYITNKINEERFNKLYAMAKGNEIKISKEAIGKIVDYANAFPASRFYLAGKDGQIAFKAENEQNDIKVKFKAKEKFKQFHAEIPRLFLDLLNILKTDIVLSAKTDSPIYIKVVEDDLEFNYIVAPIAS